MGNTEERAGDIGELGKWGKKSIMSSSLSTLKHQIGGAEQVIGEQKPQKEAHIRGMTGPI